MLTVNCLESDHGVGSAFDVNRIDKTNAFCFRRHHDRVRSFARAEKSDASQKRAVGHAGRGENDFFSRRQIVRIIYFIRVVDAHRAQTLHARQHHVSSPKGHPQEPAFQQQVQQQAIVAQE